MGAIGSFAGGIHDEMKLLVAAGLPPAVVLKAATSTAAHYLAPDGHFGTIVPGAVADLLLVRGNPLVNIEVTRDISEVFVRGKRLQRMPYKSTAPAAGAADEKLH